MTEGVNSYDDLIETIKGGDAREFHGACERAMRVWKGVPVEGLLALKEQFHKLELEDRESHLDEALISIAEKRPGPFTEIATEPGHPLWRPSVEVLSLVGDAGYFDLFMSLLPLCPVKDLPYLIRAIGCYDGPKVVRALAPYLASDSDGVAYEALRAMKRIGGAEALRCLKEGLAKKSREGSEMTSVFEVVVRELEDAGAGG